MLVQKNPWNVRGSGQFYFNEPPPKEYTVKKLIIGIATAGLLLSAGAAFSQSAVVEKDAPAQPTAPAAQTQTNTQTAPTTQRSSTTARIGDRRDGVQRSGDNIRVGSNRNSRYSDGYRHRAGFAYAQAASRCRTTIVKTYRHGHRVIKRIRHCR